jgi:hypothetical protein
MGRRLTILEREEAFAPLALHARERACGAATRVVVAAVLVLLVLLLESAPCSEPFRPPSWLVRFVSQPACATRGAGPCVGAPAAEHDADQGSGQGSVSMFGSGFGSGAPAQSR